MAPRKRLLNRLFRPGRPADRVRSWQPVLESLEDRCLLASGYHLNPLVSDIPGLAPLTDPNLVNPWGISESAGSPFWISDNGGNVSTLYNTQGAKVPLTVSIPTPGSPLTGTGTPTGTVFNTAQAAGAFKVSGVNTTNAATSAPAIFLFATEDGTIVGWNPGVNPTGFDPAKAGTYGIIAVDKSQVPTAAMGAVYKGLAIGTDGAGVTRLYAANFRAGTVDVFDTNFSAATLPTGAFTDANIPSGFAPFNVQVLNGKVYVSYAKQDAAKHDDVAGPGNGFVDVYNLDGTGLVRLVQGGTGSPLNSPWGLALAPANFGNLSGDLLVGNFGDGTINAFDPNTPGVSHGPLKDASGNSITIDGLWALKFGNGASGGNTNTLYYTAGSLGEQHGVFGMIQALTDAPLTAFGLDITATEGGGIEQVGPQIFDVARFTDADPAAKASDFTATIDWGDGQTSAGTVAADTNGGFIVSGSHTYTDVGSSAVHVTITDTNTTNDPGGSTVTTSSGASVGDGAIRVAPLTSLATTQFPLAINNAPIASFHDFGGADAVVHYRATIDWGDATGTSDGTVTQSNGTLAPAGEFIVAGSHTYAVPGRYTVAVTAISDAGSEDTNTVTLVVGSSDQRFLAQAYQDLLQRPIDPTGLAIWGSQLAVGVSRDKVVQGITGSQEYRTDVVANLYQLLLHRVPDPGGLAAFVGFLGSGGTVEQAAASIAGSPEYLADHGGTPTGFVTALYQDALNRSPDTGGLAGFTGLLAHGGSDAQVAAAIFGSLEYQQDLVKSYYQRFLHRAADDTGLAMFTNALQQGTPDESVIAAILSSSEYGGRV
jgi:uncharacterized protein (TIGR03118 family)